MLFIIFSSAYLKSGCDHIGHNDIGHNRKPYRPHGKSISATKHYGEFITLNYWFITFACVRHGVMFRVYFIFLPCQLSFDVTYSLVYSFRVCHDETVVVNTTFSCHYRRPYKLQTRTVLTRRVSSYGLPAWVRSELGPMGRHNLYNVRSSIGTGSLLSDPGRGDPGEALTR